MEEMNLVPELIKKVKRIELKTRRQSMDLLGGQYQSAFKGKGMSFSEVRKYQYGDDIRFIDWNVTARTGIPHIKVFEEERELTVMMLVDLSGSMNFGSAESFKLDRVAELSALLSFSAIQNNDKVGLIVFDDEIREYLPPKKGRGQVFQIIKKVLSHKVGSRNTNIDLSLQYLLKVIKRRCVVFLISDFVSSGYNKSLAIAAKKHDLVGLHLSDKLEREIPDLGLIPVRDAESGEKGWIDTSHKEGKVKLREYFEQIQKDTAANLLKGGASHLSMETGENYLSLLNNFFKSRAK